MDVVDLEEENRAEQMFEAVKNNDFDVLKKILTESDDAENLTSTIHQESGSTALMFASREGNAGIAQLLLDYGAKPLQANAKHGASALHFAKSAEIVYVLLKGKADPLQRDPGGKTALMWAGWSGAREVQEALLKQKGVDVNDRATGSGSTAIHYTATTQHEDCLRLLIKAKGEVNCLSNDGRTPLHYATQTTGTISILLEAKADVNKSGPRAVSVAHIAAENGRKQVLEMLMNAKANLLATDHATGEMPLHFSAKEGKEETMRLILDSKIDVDQRGNRKKRTALMLASVHGHTHIQETLLEEYHADVNLSSSSQMTAAHYAAVKGGSDALKVLLKHSANINARHIDGRTPLYFAAQLKNTHALKLLLASKADIHEADMDQVTPIHAASMHGDVGIIECLLKAKGDVERKDCDGFTALHDAAVSGRPSVNNIASINISPQTQTPLAFYVNR